MKATDGSMAPDESTAAETVRIDESSMAADWARSSDVENS
jgi:hypothetical protein